MTNLQRIGNMILSLLLIVGGIALLLVPQIGVLVVALVLSACLLLYGVGKLLYYIRLAHHMAGGLILLFLAIIALDVAVFAVAVIDNPKLAVALYLICYCAVSGVLSVARAVESKLFGSPALPLVLQALVCLALAALCIMFINSDVAIIWIFCICLFYNAGVRLVSVFKPTEIIYIQ